MNLLSVLFLVRKGPLGFRDFESFVVLSVVGASGGGLDGGASFRVETAHFAA